jgi:thiamine biosynthesis lipoprotein
MGTRFEIVVASDDEYRVRPGIEAALAEVEDLHRKLTRFEPDSLLSHINRTAALRPIRLDAQTFALFATAESVRQRSHGAFDIALGSGGVVLNAAHHTIRFDRPGVSLDLGGIAKGYALDHAALILRDHGIESALLHGGTSSVVAIGKPPDAEAWRVSFARCATLPFVELRNASLSVSRPFSQLVDHQPHIRDPRTGTGVQQRRIAAVIGPSACEADAWSTALTVLGARPSGLGPEWTTFIELEDE